MQELIQSPVIADVALVLLAIETIIIITFAHQLSVAARSGYLANVLAGAGLLLAFRSLASGAHWTITAAAMLVALAAHFGDLYLRLRRLP